MKKLESLINLQRAMNNKEKSSEVLSKYIDYLKEYSNLENKGVKEKLEYREVFQRYIRYMDLSKK